MITLCAFSFRRLPRNGQWLNKLVVIHRRHFAPLRPKPNVQLQEEGGLQEKMAAAKVSSNMVAVCQMTSTDSKESSFKACNRLVHRASSMGAKMVFLPEACDYIALRLEESAAQAESLDGPTMTFYKQLAADHKIWLSVGSFHEKDPENANKVLNTHVIMDDHGELVGKYSKTHLFDVEIEGQVSLKESDICTPGKSITLPVATPVGHVGMGICYDLRFPEFSLMLTRQGAEILTYPSAFTQPTGMAHWEPLLRSRAIESQCYVIAAAQTGKHNANRASYGHSMIIDPWGAVVAECSEGEGVAMANIDLAYLWQIRKSMPIWNHRRTDLYSKF